MNVHILLSVPLDFLSLSSLLLRPAQWQERQPRAAPVRGLSGQPRQPPWARASSRMCCRSSSGTAIRS